MVVIELLLVESWYGIHLNTTYIALPKLLQIFFTKSFFTLELIIELPLLETAVPLLRTIFYNMNRIREESMWLTFTS